MLRVAGIPPRGSKRGYIEWTPVSSPLSCKEDAARLILVESADEANSDRPFTSIAAITHVTGWRYHKASDSPNTNKSPARRIRVAKEASGNAQSPQEKQNGKCPEISADQRRQLACRRRR